MAIRKAHIAFVAVLLLLATISGACSGASTEAEPEPTSSELAVALSNGHPTLAGFVTQACACQDVRPALEGLATEYQDRLNVTVIEYPDQIDVFAQYEVVMAPTLVFFDSGGEEVERNIGSLDREEIVDRLDALGLA